MLESLRRLTTCIRTGWHLLKELRQTVYGMYKITKLPSPCVTIFGGSHLPIDGHYARQAGEIAQRLVEAGIAVLTGGGAGIMQAANCAAAAATKDKGRIMTMGIGVRHLPEEPGPNVCVGKPIMLDYFFSRKWLLINYSIGFCVFPGGLGTVDELSDLLNLIHTKKFGPVPVILMGRSFWKPYLDWITTSQQHGLIVPEIMPYLLVTDDVAEAVAKLHAHCKQCV